MLATSGRLLRLLSLLQSPRAWTGPELAERLGVTPRTVRNDVERLRSLGYPVDATRGSVGGYRLGVGATLPPLLLDDDEAVAVTAGLRAGAGGVISGLEETSLRALAKLERVLPPRLRRRVAALSAYSVAVPRDSHGMAVDPAVLTLLAGLCRDRERLRFDYRDHAGSTAARSAEPYRLVSWGRRWYLVAYDLDRQDWRTFRVDRIAPRIPTGPRFAARDLPDPDIAAYVSGRVAAAAWRHRARVIVHAPEEVIIGRITAAVGTVEVLDERTCILDTGADSITTLAVHLGLLDTDFTVDAPPELVAHLAELSDRYRRSALTPDTAPDSVP